VIIAPAIADEGEIPVLVAPNLNSLPALAPVALIDARMTKRAPEMGKDAAPLVIGLGPGFIAGENCHAVVETMRGHNLGRVLWQGSAQADTGVPGTIATYNLDRVLRAPADGRVEAAAEIGQKLKAGQLIATVAGHQLVAPFDGVLRGLVHPSLDVKKGMKIGDVDPRNDPSYCWRVSDKSLAIGGGVLEALLTKPEIRSNLWA
jgi:xanthine dehydrogenase accessory factor